MDINVSIKVNVDQEAICHIVAAALEGGINYWALSAIPTNKKDFERSGFFLSEAFADDVCNILIVTDEGEKLELTKENLKRGIELFLNQYGSAPLVKGKIDCTHIDADVADSIIQYALFGKLVYG